MGTVASDNHSSDSDGAEQSTGPLVRPFGYVKSEPVIRRVGDRHLYLGNRVAARPDAHDETFEFVLSVSRERYPLTTHHCPLVDGPGNEWSVFEDAIDTARSLYREDGSVLVHCEAGISRSSTVIATVLAAEEERPFREALDVIHDARPLAMPNPALHELAVVYLAARSPW